VFRGSETGNANAIATESVAPPRKRDKQNLGHMTDPAVLRPGRNRNGRPQGIKEKRKALSLWGTGPERAAAGGRVISQTFCAKGWLVPYTATLMGSLLNSPRDASTGSILAVVRGVTNHVLGPCVPFLPSKIP
jgi:hypothetical protein